MKTPGIIVEKRNGVPSPASAYDAEQWAGVNDGAQFELKPMKSRSNPQNRLYWQTLHNVVGNTALGDIYPTAPKLHDALLRALGFVTIDYDLDTGKPYVTRDSTAFDKMGPDDFKEYFEGRKTVNGKDRAKEIAGLALMFESALRASGWKPSSKLTFPAPDNTPVAPPDVPMPPPIQPPPPPAPKVPIWAVVGIVVGGLLLGALNSCWQQSGQTNTISSD